MAGRASTAQLEPHTAPHQSSSEPKLTPRGMGELLTDLGVGCKVPAACLCAGVHAAVDKGHLHMDMSPSGGSLRSPG